MAKKRKLEAQSSEVAELFSKEQLLSLLKEAAEKHLDVANRIREVADEDPVHRKIFVHGLGWDTKTETLIEAFKQYGDIEDCKAVFDKITGKSKGYGFILFKSRSGARNALKQPQKKIGSRMAACQLASKGPVFGGGAPVAAAAVSAPVQHSNSEHTQKKIYVSNVGAELDPQKLLAFFSRFGEIEEGPLGLDKFTGKPKGFCLFVYKSAESAKKALEEPHKTFEGHVLHCQRAIDGPKPGKQNQQPQQQPSLLLEALLLYQQENPIGLWHHRPQQPPPTQHFKMMNPFTITLPPPKKNVGKCTKGSSSGRPTSLKAFIGRYFRKPPLISTNL